MKKALIISIGLAIVGLLLGHESALADDPVLPQIQQAIEEQGYDWTAGETSISRLTPEERRRRLGVAEEEDYWVGPRFEKPLVSAPAYPAAIDWRNVDSEDWTTSIKDQDNCGSCVAFATNAAIESRLEIYNNDSSLSPDLSEAHLFFCGGGTCDEGWQPSEAMSFAQFTGIVDETCFPYRPEDMPCNPCSGWQSRAVKISNWWGTDNTAEAKQTVADNGPVEVTMDVYTDFYYYTGGIYRHAWGDYEGRHAIVIVGYNDDDDYWIAKNSWNTDWGENGWFRIAYDQCEIDNSFYVPELLPGNGLDCDQAVPASCGGSYTGNTTGAPTNVSSYSCSGWDESGPEHVYELTISQDSAIVAVLSNLSADLDVFILSACDPGQCVAYGDTTATYSNAPASTYYIVVDGYQGASGSYVLDISCSDASAWQIRRSMGVGRSRLAVAAVNGRIYAIGGEDVTLGVRVFKQSGSVVSEAEMVSPLGWSGVVEEYDPSTNSWTTKASMLIGMSNISAGVINDKIYVAGGYDGISARSSLQVYDPAINAWSTAASLPQSRSGAASAVVNGKLYVIGGQDSAGSRTTTCYEYNPSTNSWTTKASMNQARAWAAAGVVNGRIYVVGGLGDDGNELASVEEYNPATNTWSIKAPMLTARAGPGAVGAGGYLYIVGGGWSSYLSSSERYDPSANSWVAFDPLNIGRRTLGLTEVNNKLYAVGGWNGDYSSDNEEYDLGGGGAPDIDVTPPSFEVTLSPGQSTQRTMTIRNVGQGTLTFDIRESEASSSAARKISFVSREEVKIGDETYNLAGTDKGMVSTKAVYAHHGATAVYDILVYTDDDAFPAGSTYVEQALQSLGLSYAGYYADYTQFGEALTSGDWDLVVVSHNLYHGLGNYWTEIEDSLNHGVKAVIATYDIDGSNSEPTTLWDTLGLTSISDLDIASPVYRWAAAHPIFSAPESVPDFTSMNEEYWDNGDRTDSVTATGIAGFTPSPAFGQSAILVGLDGRAVVNSFLICENDADADLDGKPDAVELWKNEISYVLETIADVTWLREDPVSGTVAPSDCQDVNVTFDSTGLSVGTYTANIIIVNNDPDENPVTVPVTLHVIEGNVDLSIVPSPKTVAVDEVFTVDIQVDAGSQPVDAVDAYLSFDRDYLRVVDASGNETNSIIPGSTLPVVLQNSVDNGTGRIIFSAGKQLGSPSPSGTFMLATIRFKALAETSGTTVGFLSRTDVFYEGNSILGSTHDGTVVIIIRPFRGQVTLQGRGSAGDPRWENFPLRVTFYPPGSSTSTGTYNATTDRDGVFSISGVSPGAYDVQVKNAHTLSRMRVNVTVPPATEPVHFCTLLEGDANDDDRVAGADFSILATVYGKCQGDTGYDGRADFNGDGCIGGADFSLLATNYGQQGPVPCSGIAAAQPGSLGKVDLHLRRSASNLMGEKSIISEIWVEAGEQGVDVVDFYVTFDPKYLQVTDVEGGSALPLVLQSRLDNHEGLLTFSAGRKPSGTVPRGAFVLVTFRSRALTDLPKDYVPYAIASGTDVFFAGRSVLGDISVESPQKR